MGEECSIGSNAVVRGDVNQSGWEIKLMCKMALCTIVPIKTITTIGNNASPTIMPLYMDVPIEDTLVEWELL